MTTYGPTGGDATSVVVDFSTIVDGYVVRWYASEDDANARHMIISASRNGVFVDRPHALTEQMEADAYDAHDLIADWYRRGGHDHKAWKKYVTHHRPFLGNVEPLAGAR
jgi:hypothetical protein